MNFLDHTLRIYRLALVLALGWMVAACGGGGGGGTGGTTGQTSYTRLQPGLFLSPAVLSAGYPETISILSPDQHWWAVRRDSGGSAAIFSGVLAQNGQGSGSITPVTGFLGSRIRSGSASMNSVSEQGLSGRISLAVDTTTSPALSETNIDVAVTKPNVAVYSSTATAVVSALNGPWLGVWIDGANSAAVTLNFSSGAISLINSASVLNCQLTNPSRVTAESGAHLYRVELTFVPGIEQCSRSHQLVAQTFSGVIAAYDLNGRQRIDLIAVDSRGSGIVFRGER